MTRDTASRIAGNLVKQFGHEKHFALRLPKKADLELLAAALRREYGCAVVWNEEAGKIAVRCPDRAKAPA